MRTLLKKIVDSIITDYHEKTAGQQPAVYDFRFIDPASGAVHPYAPGSTG
jgi:hypothetical protein